MIHTVSIGSGDIPLRSPCADTESLTGAPSPNDRRSLKERVAKIWDRFVHAVQNLFRRHEEAPVEAADPARTPDVEVPKEAPVEAAASAGIADVKEPEKKAPVEPAASARITCVADLARIKRVSKTVKHATRIVEEIGDHLKHINECSDRVWTLSDLTLSRWEWDVRSWDPNYDNNLDEIYGRRLSLGERQLFQKHKAYLSRQNERLRELRNQLNVERNRETLPQIARASAVQTNDAKKRLYNVEEYFITNGRLDESTRAELDKVEAMAQEVINITTYLEELEKRIMDNIMEMQRISNLLLDTA